MTDLEIQLQYISQSTLRGLCIDTSNNSWISVVTYYHKLLRSRFSYGSIKYLQLTFLVKWWRALLRFSSVAFSPTQLGTNFYLELEFDSGVNLTCSSLFSLNPNSKTFQLKIIVYIMHVVSWNDTALQLVPPSVVTET